jgi:hypothetical protein
MTIYSFGKDFFASLSFLSSGLRNEVYGMPQFTRVSRSTAEVYGKFLAAVDPDLKFINLNEIVTSVSGDEGQTFYGPAVWQHPEDPGQMIVSIGTSQVPLVMTGEKGDKFLLGSLEGELEHREIKDKDESGKEITRQRPVIAFELDENYTFVIDFILSDKTSDKAKFRAAIKKGNPVSLFCKTPPMLAVAMHCLVFKPGLDKLTLPEPLEIPVLKVYRTETSAKTLEKYPNASLHSYIIRLDPAFIPPVLTGVKGEDYSGNCLFYCRGAVEKQISQGFDAFQELLQTEPYKLRLNGYAKTSANGYSIYGYILGGTPPKPPTYLNVTSAPAAELKSAAPALEATPA